MTPDEPTIAANTSFSPAEEATWAAMQSEGPELPPAPEPAPAPVAAPEPEPASTPEPVAKAEKEPVEHIPLPVLLEERREFRRQLNAMKQQMEALQPKQPPQTPAIDPDNLTVDTVKTMAQKLVEYEQERERQAKMNELRNFGTAHAQEFIKTTPDFGDAYNHLRMARAQQLIDAGAVADQNQLLSKIQEEEADLLHLAARWNVNPAGLAYALAQSAGYQRAAPAPTPAVAQPSAVATPPRDDTGKFVKVDAKTKVEMAAKGHEQAANPVSSAGAGQGGPLDLAALARLDGDEFDKATSGKNWEKLWRNA